MHIRKAKQTRSFFLNSLLQQALTQSCEPVNTLGGILKKIQVFRVVAGKQKNCYP